MGAYIYYKGFSNKDLLPLGILLVFSTVIEIILEVVARVHVSNLWLMYPFLIVEFICLAMVINSLSTRKMPSYVLPLLLIILIGMEAFEMLYVNGFQKFATVSRTTESFMLVLLSLYAFVDILRNEQEIYLQNVPLFWIAVAVMLYSAGNLFVFSTYNIIAPSEKANYWMVHSVLNIALNLLLAKFIQCQVVQYKSR